MKKLLTVFSVALAVWGCTKNSADQEDEQLTRIAFGSCCAQYLPDKKIFDRIVEKDPQLFIFGGDNVYADFFALAPGTPDYIRGSYASLGGDKAFQRFRAQIPILATWDDHDTGENDGTTTNPVKAIAKAEFFKFWNVPADAPRANRPDGGIYDAVYYGDDAHRVQIILLDLRYNHSAYKSSGAGAALSGYDTMMSPDATILGATQWAWLEQELLKPAKVRIIMSSLQFNSFYNGGENWAVLPLEKQKMIDLLKSTRAEGAFFLSGDVHFAEFTKTQPDGMYPIYDFTASGMTHHEAKVGTTNDAIRVGNGWNYVNFGMLTIDWKSTPVSIKAEIYGNTDPLTPKVSHTVTLDELKF